MRFITEFEIDPLHKDAGLDYYRSNSEHDLGHLIAEAFGWQERGDTTLAGPIKERHTLEVEAFPMDKWVEFRNALGEELNSSFSLDKDYIIELLEKLESFGKPSGDIITNQQLNK